MNTDVTVITPDVADAGEQALASQIAHVFADTEQRFSRFRDESELSTLNRATESIVVSPELLDLLRAARRYVADTHGLFDPAIGAALRSAGYDRSFSPGMLDRDTPSPSPRAARFDELVIDEHTRRVTRPAPLQLDFSGFLKGRTVDRAVAMLPSPAWTRADASTCRS